ncbi:MAG: glycosyltransferase [Phycisphaerales bacterium]
MTLRILHLINSIDPTTGGPANVLLRLATIQARRGHTVTIITSDDPGDIESEMRSLETAGVRLITCGPARGPLRSSPRHVPAVRDAIARGIDIAHLHGLWQHLVHWGASTLRASSVPHIIRPCGMLDPWTLRQGRWKKRAMLAFKARADLNAANALHFTTQTEMDLTRPLRLRAPGFVLPNGIEWSEFDSLPPPGAFRRSLSLDPDTPLVLFLSRLHHKKGIDLLLPAFAAGAPSNARLVLVGPGDPETIARVDADAQRLGIAGRVIRTGMLRGADRIAAFADADLFCLPSYQENFGVVVVEAGAAGTPVLISDQVNIHQQISDAGCGRVVSCEVKPLSETLRDMLADPDALKAMGARAREHHRHHFAWDRIADQLTAHYHRLLASDTSVKSSPPIASPR